MAISQTHQTRYKGQIVWRILCAGILFFTFNSVGFSEEDEKVNLTDSAPKVAPKTDNDSTEKTEAKPRRKTPREKEADGTQAPKRFDTDILKSKYKLNGQPLEIDTE